MDVLRDKFDGFYDFIKPGIFWATAPNPEWAHYLFFGALRGLGAVGWAEKVLDNSANRIKSDYLISNAAGFYKNAEIDPRLMRLLGFDRVVVGTVTAKPWKGNKYRPRIWRFPETKSLVNCMGLPGVGADKVAKRLRKYGNHGVPLTVNLMATPDPKMSYADKVEDVRRTVSRLKDVPYVDCFEVNPTCPNTRGSDGLVDARSYNLSMLGDMLGVIRDEMHLKQDLYVKASPDSTREEVDGIVKVCEKYFVDGYTVANSSTDHDPAYITRDIGKGGASGAAVWKASKRTQKYFADILGDSEVKLIACGGIDSVEGMNKRLRIGNCNEVQILTGLIFEGTGLLRKLRAA